MAEPKNNGKRYLEIIVIILIAIAPALVSHGVMRADVADLQRRIEDLEHRVDKNDHEVRENNVPRKEYETWQRDLNERLNRIELKVDKLKR